jgi:valyl-tRNA synthetase
MGREAFLSEIWSWKEHHGNVILGQLRRLGASCDWTRTKFTLDDDMSTAVREAFVSLYERGLVYRGARLVNWDCKLQTAISDDEIEYKQQKGHMWYLRYPVKDSGQFVTVGTTRPETMLADTGVAVHPDDARYADLIGKTLLLPIVNREIPIVADESVERELGTGAVKVTPGHDPADYERGRRNNLPILNLLEKDGKLTDVGGPFAGLTKEAARKAVIEWFEANELLDHIEDITHNISISDRSKTPIEPLVSEQWFVKMQPLAEPAIEAVHDGSLEFKQARWKKVYLDWLENVHDWCISRQLWWGHRIPVWYDEDDTPFPSRVDVEIGSLHPDTGKPIVRQDPDVLDTWASSWLWPFATLGWPNEEATDLNRFYPTQFLSTARDIIYLWVARMVMAGYAFRKELPIQERCPFSTCYIHATVLDGKGRRMSKSAGNGIDPVEMIEKYGADAVRYSLMILTREGQDVKLAANRFELGQRFCNKIWNVSRFALGHLEGDIAEDCGDALEDRWIQARLDSVTAEVTTALGQYDFHDAAQALYRFTWDDFCDWYVESAKRRLRLAEDAGLDSAEAADAARVRRTLGNTLAQLLKLLHPFTPFLTERLWEHLPSTFRSVEGMLMGAEWPVVQDKCETPAEVDYAALQDAVRGFRNVRALLEIAASDKPVGTILANDEAMAQSMRANGDLLSYLAGLSELQVQTGGQRPADSGTDLFVGGSVFLPFTAETDASKLRDSLEKKALKISKGIQAIDGKLANERFIQNAGDDVVESERQRRVELEIEHSTLKANLSALS